MSGRAERFFSSPEHSDKTRGPDSLLLKGYMVFSPIKRSGQELKLKPCVHQVTKLTMELYFHAPYMPLWRVQGKFHLLLSSWTWTEFNSRYEAFKMSVCLTRVSITRTTIILSWQGGKKSKSKHRVTTMLDRSHTFLVLSQKPRRTQNAWFIFLYIYCMKTFFLRTNM